jgi:hypothetical protein
MLDISITLWQKYIFIGLLGGLAAVLSQRCLAVFHDGLRPIMPDFKEGKIDHKSMMITAFALCFGLIIGFGIPVSIGAMILLIHAVLLGTDLIGILCPKGNIGSLIAFIVGMLYAILLLTGLEAVVECFSMLPINFMSDLNLVGAPVIIGYSLFPALVIGYQYGFKKGVFAAILTLLIKQLIFKYGQAVPMFGTNVKFNADGMAIMVGMVVMLSMAMMDKTQKQTGNNAMLLNLFATRVQGIRKSWWLFGITGGLIAACTSLGLIAGDPVSLALLSKQQYLEAGITAIAVAIGFLSLVGTTAITTGLYSPAGMKFVFVAGIFVSTGFLGDRFGAMTPIMAFCAGFAAIACEVLILSQLAIFLDRFPGVKACGDHIRSCTTKVLEIALLIGGAMAAQKISPQLGFYWVAGFYLLNKISKKPLVEMAVGPIAAISLGILVNILFVLGLY